MRAVVGVVLLGAATRFAALGRGELWSDEAYSALLSRETLHEIVRELSGDSSPPLYYALLHAWRAFAGGDAAALRSLSAFAGAASVYMCYRLGAVMFTGRVGVIAALMLAVSPLHVYYSQVARPYAALVLFALGSLLGLHRLATGDVVRGAALYCSATTLAAYTHNYGMFLLVPIAVAVALHRLRVQLAATCAVLVGIAYLPWAPVLAQQIGTGAAQWAERIWRQTPPSAALLKSLGAFSIGGAAPPYVPLGSQPRWVHAVAYVAFGALALRALFSRDGQRRNAQLVAGYLILLLGVPYLISFAVPIYVAGRYDVVGLPLFLLLCAAGAEGLRRRKAFAAGVVVVVLAGMSLSAYYTQEPLRGARRQASAIVANSGPDDVVLAMGFARNSVEYYVREASGGVRFHSFPSSLDVHRGWLDERQVESSQAAATDAAHVAERLADRHRPGGRLWIVHSGLLGDAATVLLARVNLMFAPVPCPDGAEAFGLSCWMRRPPSDAAWNHTYRSINPID